MDLRPLGGISGRLKPLLDAARAAVNPDVAGQMSVDTGGVRLKFDAPPVPQIALFEILDRWHTHNPSSSGNFPDEWAWVYGRPVYYFTSKTWGSYDQDQKEQLYHPAGYHAPWTSGLLDNHWFMPRYAVGDWAWCVWDQAAGFWQILDRFENIVRVHLDTSLEQCSFANGKLIIGRGVTSGSGDGWDYTVDVTVRDAMGVVASSALAKAIGPDVWSLPAGTCCYCRYFGDMGWWELIATGDCECSSSSGSSGSSSCVTPDDRRLGWVPGFDVTKKQALIHDHGCLQWMDIGLCASSSGS